MIQPLRFLCSEPSAAERRHTGPVTGLAIIGTRLISAGQDQRILNFEPLPKGPLQFKGPELRATAPFTDLQVVVGDELTKVVIVAACRDNDIRLWEVQNVTGGRTAAESSLVGHSGPVCSVDAKQTFVLSASMDCTARVWDLQARSEVIAAGHPREVSRALFFPRSTLCATQCKDSATRVWDLRQSVHKPSYVIQELGHAHGPGSIAINENGFLATGH